jgi:hypothetical protein
MWTDNLITSTEAINWLGFHHEHFKAIVEIGFLAPVAYGDDRKPRFSKNQVEALRRDPLKYEQLREVISDNFGRFGSRRGRKAWERANDPTRHHPYASPGQAAWARRRQELASRVSRSGEAWREIDAVLVVHERNARERFRKDLWYDADTAPMRAIKRTREELWELVWSKPMDTVATELGTTETPLRNLCAECFVPTPGRGHFKFKDPVDRPPRTPLPQFPRSRPSPAPV